MISTELNKAVNEKDVENIYRAELTRLFSGSSITSPHHVDGLLETKEGYNVLLEFKFNQLLKNKLTQCNVLIQALYYLKKFEMQGVSLPSAVFVGDNNECFIVPSKSITKYLNHKLDWNIPASDAYRRNPQLVTEMMTDTDIDPFVFDVDTKFKSKDLIEKIQSVATNSVYKVKVTGQNIQSIFEYFQSNVLPKNSGLSTNQEANMFVQLVINPNENYVHPKRNNILLTKNFGEVKINGSAFSSFFKHYEGETYSPREKEKLTGFIDRLVEESTRRRKGEFFTPTMFVDKSQEYITSVLGPDWRDEYVVWDCAWGTGNLTRDYQFKELYCSTLEQSDIDTANQAGYNPTAIKFQFDFLNDDDSKLPAGLLAALSDPKKKVLFYINPPYGTAKNGGSEDGNSKAGIADTLVGKLMREERWGAASQQLYAQFLYRIAKYNENKNVVVAAFAPSLYKTGSSYSGFRANFYKKFEYQKGMLFCASHFSDTASSWGVDFSVWTSGKETRDSLVVDVLDVNPTTHNVFKQATKTLYNLDKATEASEWVRQEIKGKKTTTDIPMLTSALCIKDSGRGSAIQNAYGYMHSNGNNIMHNQTLVGLYSTAFAAANGFSVVAENTHKTTALFAARKLIERVWENSTDEYLAPNEQHPDYQQFVYDSFVYALFNNKSNQSSLRQVTYKGKKHDIKNEFFWLSKDHMLKLAEDNSYDELYRDAKNNGTNRFIHNTLFVKTGSVFQLNDVYNKVSPDAKAVLDMATALVNKSISIRQLVSQQHPEYHLDAWDAGYAQLKLVWKDYFKDDFKAFRDAYKALEDRMRPLVYTLGFLK